MGVFYADDGMIRSRNPKKFQGAINFLVGIFIRFSLIANLAKSETMT